MGGPNSGAKDRKKGEWEAVARGRNGKTREMRPGRGLSNIPKIGEIGGAAYRRSLVESNRKHR